MRKKIGSLFIVILITAFVIIGSSNPAMSSENSLTVGNTVTASGIPVTISGPTILENNTPMVWTVNLPSYLQDYMIHYTVTRGNDRPFSWDSTSPICSFSAYSPTPITIVLNVTVTAPGYSPGSATLYIYTRFNTSIPRY